MFCPSHRQSSVIPKRDRMPLYHCPEIQRNFSLKMKRPPLGGHYRKCLPDYCLICGLCPGFFLVATFFAFSTFMSKVNGVVFGGKHCRSLHAWYFKFP
jgi:hypothetical protein